MIDEPLDKIEKISLLQQDRCDKDKGETHFWCEVANRH